MVGRWTVNEDVVIPVRTPLKCIENDGTVNTGREDGINQLSLLVVDKSVLFYQQRRRRRRCLWDRHFSTLAITSNTI